MRINTEKVVVGMPPPIYQALKGLAEERKQTVSAYVRRLIWKNIEEKDVTVSVFQKGRQ